MMMKPKYYIKSETATAKANTAKANIEDDFPSLGKAKNVSVVRSSTLNYLEAAKTVPVVVEEKEKEEEVVEEDKKPIKKGFSFD
jgi:hypothetical protein